MKPIATIVAIALCLQIEPPLLFAQTDSTRTANRDLTITVKDLGTFGRNITVPEAINNRGELAVNAWDNQGWQGAIYWSARTGFVEVTPGRISGAVDINDQGRVVGIYNDPKDNSTHGFVWSARDRELVDLGSFAPVDINNKGLMLGQCWEPATPYVPHYCLYDDGEFYPLPAEASQPQHINDRGVVVGYLDAEPGRLGAFTWSRRESLSLLAVPPGFVEGLGRAINDRGTVFGSMTSDPDFGSDVATLWNRKGEAQALPISFIDFVFAINNKNWMLQRNNRLWIGASGPFILPGPPGLDEGREPVVTNLNDRGDIVGWGVVDGQIHAVYWTVQQ